MSKVRDSKKKDERKAALEPYSQMKHLEESLSDLTQRHKAKLNNLKTSFKLLTEDVKKLKQDVVKNQDIIKDLRDDIAVKNEELAKAAQQQHSLDVENKELKQKLVKIEQKFANLEVSYDKNVANMSLESTRLKQEMENQANVHKKMDEEYAEHSNKLKESLLEKSHSHAELSEKLKELMLNFEEYKESCSKKHEEAIAALKAEVAELNTQLVQKAEELLKVNTEKRELEESKNKIIDEQTYKIREIERIFEQPLKRVQPQLTNKPVSPQQVAPLPFSDQPSVSVISPNLPNTVIVQAKASRTDTIQSVRSTQISQGTVVSRKATKRRQRERHIIPSPTNEISNSDTDSDISYHKPNFPVDINNNRTAVAVDPSAVRGFGTLKRSYVQNRNVLDTSESEVNFSQLKRSRN